MSDSINEVDFRGRRWVRTIILLLRWGTLRVFGGMPNALAGEPIIPNQHKLAREFTLFDNGCASRTDSADGHAWSTRCLANDYLKHFCVG
jgi:hypothetical protein